MKTKHIIEMLKRKFKRELVDDEKSMVKSAFELGKQAMYDDFIESNNVVDNKQINFIPHIHICELKLLNKKLKQYCPYKGKLSKDEHECDYCNRFIIIEFKDDDMTMIDRIIR